MAQVYAGRVGLGSGAATLLTKSNGNDDLEVVA